MPHACQTIRVQLIWGRLERYPLLASPDYSCGLVVTRFIGSDPAETAEDRMNAVTTNGL